MPSSQLIRKQTLSWKRLNSQIVTCRKCPRLVKWREKISREKTRRFLDWDYWGRPMTGFGDIQARLLVIGLAPAAHGTNRTGRVFTGDRSGDWLYRALYKAGFANQPTSVHRDDGLKLNDCFVTAVVRCAPPLNKPLPQEFKNCRPFLINEFDYLKRTKVIIGLGKIGFDNGFKAFQEAQETNFSIRPKFSHGAEFKIAENITLLGTYHPSQQNTFTKRLTEDMLDKVFVRAKQLIK